MTPSALPLGNYGILVQQGHAGCLVSTVWQDGDYDGGSSSEIHQSSGLKSLYICVCRIHPSKPLHNPRDPNSPLSVIFTDFGPNVGIICILGSLRKPVMKPKLRASFYMPALYPFSYLCISSPQPFITLRAPRNPDINLNPKHLS